MCFEGVDWVDLAQDRDPMRGFCEHGNETTGSLKVENLNS